jgi:hypothetical protein
MKDYKKKFEELGFAHDSTFGEFEYYRNFTEPIIISFRPEDGEIHTITITIDTISIGEQIIYYDGTALWSLINTIAAIENKLLKSGFVFSEYYTFALPNERKKKREMSNNNRKEHDNGK